MIEEERDGIPSAAGHPTSASPGGQPREAAPKMAMAQGRVIPIPVFIDVHDVMVSMKCKRATAYAHMRRALNRRPGQRGQLRVPVYVWQRYVDERFDPAIETEPEPEPGASCPVRVTQARAGKGRSSTGRRHASKGPRSLPKKTPRR